MGTHLLLDVDGVLNGGSRPGWGGPPRTSRASAHGQAYRIRWAPQAIARLRGLHEAGVVTIWWATTWIDHDVTQIEKLVGLPSLGLAYPSDSSRAVADDFRMQHHAAKLAAALRVVRQGQRLIWVDDDAIPSEGPERAELDDAEALLIAPSPGRGIRPEHLDAIEAYAAS